jgi:BirA family transcriptional regulator, biotin operon repressor / biotin---[acetyl-CoA-carboxylase] ligase
MDSAALKALSEHVLAEIRVPPNRPFRLEDVAEEYDCEPSDVLFAIDSLRQAGYKIDADSKGVYKFISAPDFLLATEILHGLKTDFIGRRVYAYQSVQSTNIIATQLAEAKAPNGAVVVAELQTRGRGRLGRSWHSPEKKGIYLSIILYPDIDPPNAPGLSIMTAVSLAEVISGYVEKDVNIKWPNDCLIDGRKTAGILTELFAERGKTGYVIVGIGINVNHARKDFPAEIVKSATSIGREAKKTIRRVELLQKFLTQFEKDYRKFCKGGLKALQKKILTYSNLIGRQVRLDMSGRTISGTVTDIDDYGNLVLVTPAGPRRFNAGEVTVVKS